MSTDIWVGVAVGVGGGTVAGGGADVAVGGGGVSVVARAIGVAVTGTGVAWVAPDPQPVTKRATSRIKPSVL